MLSSLVSRIRPPATIAAFLGCVLVFTGVSAHGRDLNDQSWRPLFALNLDSGFAFDLGTHRLNTTAALGTGLSLYNGTEFWSGTVEMLGMRGERWALGAGLEYLRKVPVAMGATFTGHYDLTNRAPGVSAGVSLNIIHLSGMVFFDNPADKLVFLYLRLPLGYMGYLWAQEH